MMEEKITIQAIVASKPVMESVAMGTDMVSFLVQTNVQSFDLRIGGYTQSRASVYKIIAYNNLARNVYECIKIRQRIVATGSLYISPDPRDKSSVLQAEIKLDSIGHDLNWHQTSLKKDS